MRIRWPRLEVQHIYFSPHPDDVVLSCGGMIWEQTQRGERVAVVTVFAASPSPANALSPFAQSLHERWQASSGDSLDFADPPTLRRAEDLRSIQALGPTIEVIYLPLADCIYRHHPVTGEALYASEEAIFGEVHPADPARAYFEQLPPIPPELVVYSPLSVGHHVDHQLVRSVIEGWGLPKGRLRYYEDYPYVLEPGALEKVIGEQRGWVPVVFPIDEAAVNAKIAAVTQHASQISTFWQSIDAMASGLRAQAEIQGGERLWIHAGVR